MGLDIPPCVFYYYRYLHTNFHKTIVGHSISFLAACYFLKLKKKLISNSCHSCSSADETEDGELDPDIKAQREKERRQANNARERCESLL